MMPAGESRTLFARYTTLIGRDTTGYPYPSDPWEVLPYNEVVVEVFTAAKGGTLYKAWLEESNDLRVWTQVGAKETCDTAGVSKTLTASDTAQYVRLMIGDFLTAGVGIADYFCLWAEGVARHG